MSPPARKANEAATPAPMASPFSLFPEIFTILSGDEPAPIAMVGFELGVVEGLRDGAPVGEEVGFEEGSEDGFELGTEEL